jgi:uncharacterized protein YydD (DUF2326 family)
MNYFDISIGCTELKKIEVEIKRVQSVVKDLKTKKAELEAKIQKYLTEHQHQGVMINDITVVNEAKKRTKPLAKKEKEERIANLLKQHNIEAPEKIMTELTQVTKGTPLIKNQITINYPKPKQ